MVQLLRAARIPALAGAALAPAAEAIDRSLSFLLGKARDPEVRPASPGKERLFSFALALAAAALLALLLHFILATLAPSELLRAFGLGLHTLARVVLLLAVASLIWTPIGVAIGFQPRLARLLQPLVQFLSSFPANFLFPFATIFFLRAHVPIGWGSILLMALGAQWYILFNSIAGAQSIPTDLREMADDVGLHGLQRWRQLILPGIFSAWVTGGVTASGGAWNASIVAEVVSWGGTTLQADGLGAYIADATRQGDWPRIALGIGLMSLFVVAGNQLLWRRLYALAERRYHL